MATGLLFLMVGGGVALAPAAAAAEGPPEGRVTHGPSCRPGGLVVEVTATDTPYFVRLATTRDPDGEDEATLAPGQTVVLRTEDVAWGETIDGRLEYTARDGSGAASVDELEFYSFTRPTKEDCDAVNNPRPSTPSPSSPPSSGAGGTSTNPRSPAPSSSAGSSSPTPVTPTPSGSTESGPPPGTSAPSAPTAQRSDRGGSGTVAAGDEVTLRGTGFQPGEQVDVRLHGSGELLGTALAGPDGAVDAQVRIPAGTAPGAASLDLVGAESALVANVQVQIAAATSPIGESGAASLVPLAAAAAALVGTAGALAAAIGRRSFRRRR